MKKIIFGLVLTVAFSGVALAGSSVTAEVKNSKNSKLEFDKKFNTLNLKKLFDCYYATKIRIEMDGHNYDITVDEGPSPCNQGDADGTIRIKFIAVY